MWDGAGHQEAKVLDRRVSLSQLPEGYSGYTLARAWLHNHPERLSSAAIAKDLTASRCVRVCAFSSRKCRGALSLMHTSRSASLLCRLKLPPLGELTAAERRMRRPLRRPQTAGCEKYLREVGAMKDGDEEMEQDAEEEETAAAAAAAAAAQEEEEEDDEGEDEGEEEDGEDGEDGEEGEEGEEQEEEGEARETTAEGSRRLSMTTDADADADAAEDRLSASEHAARGGGASDDTGADAPGGAPAAAGEGAPTAVGAQDAPAAESSSGARDGGEAGEGRGVAGGEGEGGGGGRWCSDSREAAPAREGRGARARRPPAWSREPPQDLAAKRWASTNGVPLGRRKVAGSGSWHQAQCRDPEKILKQHLVRAASILHAVLPGAWSLEPAACCLLPAACCLPPAAPNAACCLLPPRRLLPSRLPAACCPHTAACCLHGCDRSHATYRTRGHFSAAALDSAARVPSPRFGFGFGLASAWLQLI